MKKRGTETRKNDKNEKKNRRAPSQYFSLSLSLGEKKKKKKNLHRNFFPPFGLRLLSFLLQSLRTTRRQAPEGLLKQARKGADKVPTERRRCHWRKETKNPLRPKKSKPTASGTAWEKKKKKNHCPPCRPSPGTMSGEFMFSLLLRGHSIIRITFLGLFKPVSRRFSA